MQINPYTIDHVVINVDECYQNNPNFIAEANSKGLLYEPKKGKGTKGFKASNFWLGQQYLELIYIKSKDGGGWIKEWVDRFHSGHRGVIGVFLKTDNINDTTKQLKSYGISNPERISFPFFFNLIKISAQWLNSYLPFFKKVPFQLGFQQVDSKKVEDRMLTRMLPNSSDNGIQGIHSIIYYGPFETTEFEWLKQAFQCVEKDSENLMIPLLNNQELHFCISKDIKTEIKLVGNMDNFSNLSIENITISI